MQQSSKGPRVDLDSQKPTRMPLKGGRVQMSSKVVADIIEWEVPNWSKALTFWEGHTRQDLRTVKALELGGKRGGLSLWVALQGGHALCTDLRNPEAIAAARHAQHDVSGQITYAALDALQIPHPSAFNVVMFKSLLADVGRAAGSGGQAEVVRQAHAALCEGGELFFAENVAGSPLHQVLRRRFVPWGGDMRYPSIPELLAFMSPFRDVQYATYGFLGVLGRWHWLTGWLARLDRWGIDRLVPARWRYLLVGVARK